MRGEERRGIRIRWVVKGSEGGREEKWLLCHIFFKCGVGVTSDNTWMTDDMLCVCGS
jgi:hypothetical protein